MTIKDAFEIAETFRKNGFLDVYVDAANPNAAVVVARDENKWHQTGMLTVFRRDENL